MSLWKEPLCIKKSSGVHGTSSASCPKIECYTLRQWEKGEGGGGGGLGQTRKRRLGSLLHRRHQSHDSTKKQVFPFCISSKISRFTWMERTPETHPFKTLFATCGTWWSWATWKYCSRLRHETVMSSVDEERADEEYCCEVFVLGSSQGRALGYFWDGFIR